MGMGIDGSFTTHVFYIVVWRESGLSWAELSWGCWLFLLFLVAYLAYWKRPSGQSEAKQRPKPPSAAINFKNVAGQRTRRWLKSKTPLLPLPLPLLSLLLCCCCCCSAAVAVAVAAAGAGGSSNTFANPTMTSTSTPTSPSRRTLTILWSRSAASSNQLLSQRAAPAATATATGTGAATGAGDEATIIEKPCHGITSSPRTRLPPSTPAALSHVSPSRHRRTLASSIDSTAFDA